MSKWIVITILLLASGLFAVLQEPMLFLNPGQIITGHAKIEGDCFQCHDALLGPSDAKCITCHKPSKIGAEKSGKIAFHQQLQESRCTNCHTDHMGANAGKTTHGFDHSLLIATEQKSCQKCHTPPQNNLHKDMTKQCDNCHGREKWRPATLDHTRLFRFDSHHPDKCTDCHENNVFDRYTCYSCHEHSPSKIRHEHLEEGIRNFQNCTACHRSGDEDEAERIWRTLRRQGISPDSIGKAQRPLDYGLDKQGRNQHRHKEHEDHHDDN